MDTLIDTYFNKISLFTLYTMHMIHSYMMYIHVYMLCTCIHDIEGTYIHVMYFSNPMSHGPIHNVSKSSTFPSYFFLRKTTIIVGCVITLK